MRASILTLMALLAAAPADAAGGVTHAERSDQVLEARGLRRLHVENPRGLIQVRESRDGRLHVTAHRICRGRDREQALAHAAATQVSLAREGDTQVVRVTYPRRTRVEIGWRDLLRGGDFSDLSRPRAEVRLLIEAPRALAMDLRTAGGDVDVRGDFAPLEAQSTSGDIVFRGRDATLRSTSGDLHVLAGRRVRASTRSGDCTADSLSAPFTFESTSGGLVLGDAADSVRVRTTSGDIAIRRAWRGLDGEARSGGLDVAAVSGRVRLATASGAIRLHAVPPLAGLDASTASGELAVRLAHGTGARLEAETRSGGIDCSIPITLERSERRRIAGRIGSGGPPIRLSSASGDITVSSGGR